MKTRIRKNGKYRPNTNEEESFYFQQWKPNIDDTGIGNQKRKEVRKSSKENVNQEVYRSMKQRRAFKDTICRAYVL